MKQSTAIKILNSISLFTIVLVFAMLIVNNVLSDRYDVCQDEKDSLIANAERFHTASAYLTQEVRSYPVQGIKYTMIITGTK